MSQDLSELPPAYASINSSSNAIGQPPAYSNPPNDSVSSTPSSSQCLPSSFTVGSKLTPQLVSVAEVQGHLALLYAFAEFKAKVDSLLGEDASEHVSVSSLMPEDKEKRWAWFVGLAAERYVESTREMAYF